MMEHGAGQLAFTTLAQSTCPTQFATERVWTAADFLAGVVKDRSDYDLGQRLAWNSAMLESAELVDWEREALDEGMFSVPAEARRELLQEQAVVWRELDRRKLIRKGCSLRTGRYPELGAPPASRRRRGK